MRGFLFVLAIAASGAAWAAPGYSVWGDFKYPPGFAHFDYVNVNAPKGGELSLVAGSRVSNFDKFNPFTIKGREPSFLLDMLFEPLLTPSYDEVGVAYGLLAEDVDVPADRLSATFRLRQEARFHNGDPVLAADVKHSYEQLFSPDAKPAFASAFAEVAGVDLLDERTVRFRFKKAERELPLLVGSIPIFSRKWGMVDGKPKPFGQIVTEYPIATGPYRIGQVRSGKDVTYVRDPNYWARDLPARRGQNNFDKVTVKIYTDNTAQLEAFKAGEFDLMQFYSAGDWFRRLTGPRVARGELVKSPFTHRRPDGYYSYMFNLRRPMFQDRRVRMAFELAMDYEWMNRQLFRGAYSRIKGIFGNTDCEANGLPSPAEVAMLEPYRAVLPPETFGPMAVPPTTTPPHSIRENLRQARLLLQEAGWTYRDGALRNAKGEAFTFEYVDTIEGRGDTLAAQWRGALQKLGIEMRYVVVDWALFQERVDNFKFDMVVIAAPGTHFPGVAYLDLFGSKAADTVGSANWMGIKDKAVDGLIAKFSSATDRDTFIAACKAMDRVVAHQHYMVPAWTNRDARVAYNDWRLERPKQVPLYPPESSFAGDVAYMIWPISTWWARNPPITK
jgi:microcin C transport system substrate-binding protein